MEPLLTTKEVAKLLHLSEHTLRVHRCNGNDEIPYYKIGHAVRYRQSDIIEYLDNNRVSLQEVNDHVA